MGSIAILDSQALENRVRLLDSVEVSGLTHLIAPRTGRIGISYATQNIWIPTKLLLPNGKEPKILRATAPINGYIKYQHGLFGEDVSKEISKLISYTASTLKERLENINGYFKPNAFSLSELRRTAEYYAGKFIEDNPLWQFNLVFYKIKK